MRRLRELAKLKSIFPSYLDVWGKGKIAPEATLLSLLELRGVRVRSEQDVEVEIERIRSEIRNVLVEPVQVHWLRSDVSRPCLTVKTTADELPVEVCAENQDTFHEVLSRERESVFRFRRPLSAGYYDLRFRIDGTEQSTLLIVAPARGYEPAGERSWGVFVPPYAPAREKDFGAGDVSHLQEIAMWAHSLGASYLSTLPLGPTFLEPEYHEVSPYAGISRVLWNELYVDLPSAPLISVSPSAQALMQTSEFQRSLAQLRASDLVDHVGVMQRKREVMAAAAKDAFASDNVRGEIALETAANPHLERYSRFRATHELLGKGWSAWRENARDLAPADHPIAREYLLGQMMIRRQMKELRASGVRLYLDFPLGTHSEGYDTWLHQELFLHTASAGAPPDHAYAKGQSWGFPPLDPDNIRAEKYRYVRECVAHHLSAASMLRIDHVMGLHRLYVVPPGMPAAAGAYIRYRAEELYAILTLESHRAKAAIIGEDLGTVPAYVRRSIDRHRFRRLFVVQRRLVQNLPDPPGEPISNMVASLNTHDMYPFAAWWNGLDIPDRADVGLLDTEGAEVDRKRRGAARERLLEFLSRRGTEPPQERDAKVVMDMTMNFLGRSEAAVVLFNIEDLWLEEKPQNIPTTTHQRPNWKRRLRLTNEILFADTDIRKRLDTMNATRKESS